MPEVKNIMQPLISIILPCYNGEKYLSKSIESCLNQTYKNIELIIVDDCSTDASLKIARDYQKKDERIKIITNTTNKRLPASLNIGHRIAKGDLLTWTSHDNVYEPIAIETLVVKILEGKTDIVYANFFLIDDVGKIKKETILPEIDTLIFGNCIGACFLYYKEVYLRNEGYNENLFLVEDYDFWLRAFKHSKFYHLDKTLYRYRIHQNSLSSEIMVDVERKKMWKEKSERMYSVFFSTYLGNHKEIVNIFTNNLTYQYLDFSLLIVHNKKIELLKNKMKKNTNISTDKALEITFLKQFVRIMVNNQDKKSNLRKCLFIAKNYFAVLDKNSFKTLIKYSFFK